MHLQHTPLHTYSTPLKHAPVRMFHSAEHDRFEIWTRWKKLKVWFVLPAVQGRAGPQPALGEAVLWVADFDGTPVAGSYQTDEAQQVGECPGDVGGVVTTGKAPSTNLLTKLQLVYYISLHLIYVQTAVVRTQHWVSAPHQQKHQHYLNLNTKDYNPFKSL